jgi:hypothetical protein
LQSVSDRAGFRSATILRRESSFFGHGVDGDVKVQLDNLFRAWLKLDLAGRSAAISRFVTG